MACTPSGAPGVNARSSQPLKLPEPAVLARVPVHVSYDDRYFQDKFQKMPRKRPHRSIDAGKIGRDTAKMRGPAVGQHGINRQHIFERIAVAQRARAAGIVAHQAAERRARGGGNIHRKPQPVRLQRAVKLVKNDARLDHAAAAGNVDLQNPREIFRAIDDERFVDRLPRLRGAAAAWQHADAFRARQRNCLLGLRDASRNDDAHWHYLIMRRVGGVAAAGEAVEMHFGQFGLEPALQPRHLRYRHGQPSLSAVQIIKCRSCFSRRRASCADWHPFNCP